MTNLTPEKRLDRNGKLVTKHVKAVPPPTSTVSLPAPSVPAPAPGLPKSMTEQREWNGSWDRKYSDDNLKLAVFKKSYLFGDFKFECSDVEAYEVARVSHGADAFVLLSAGIRSKEEAVALYTEHGLSHLIRDHDDWVDEALARHIPAQTSLTMAGSYGSRDYIESPYFVDALEANSVRVLRDIQSYPTVPDLIMKGEVSLTDVKTIGATRLAKFARRSSAVMQLQKIQSGTSSFDAETMKQIMIKRENDFTHQLTDPITMARQYGAEAVLNLRYFDRAADFLRNFVTRRYDMERSGAITTYHDDLYHYCAGRYVFSADDVFLLFESGATVKEAINGIKEGHSVLQIAAMAQNVQPSISGGWL